MYLFSKKFIKAENHMAKKFSFDSAIEELPDLSGKH